MITTISEVKRLFGDYVKSCAPELYIQYINKGDYPKFSGQSALISVEIDAVGTPKCEVYEESETVVVNHLVTFTVDVIGADAMAHAKRITTMQWHSNSWKGIYQKMGLSAVTTPIDLSAVETGAVIDRRQFKMSFYCKMTETDNYDAVATLPYVIIAGDAVWQEELTNEV